MKFFYIGIIVSFLLMTGCENKHEQPEWQKKYQDQQTVREMFANPPMFYAPHAFWFWDDTIRDENFAASMIDEMAKQGLNPGYAHPRSSMDRLNAKLPSLPYEQYLEDPWFNSFGNALQRAKDNGLTLGYCDEYDWPSGQAAGRVLKQQPELEAKYLDWSRHEVEGKTTVNYKFADFAVAAKLTKGKIDSESLQVIGEGTDITWTVPEGNWVVYTYTKKFHAGLDGGKVNYLDPQLMNVFIPLVHEQYAERFNNDMGNSILGVFVDNEGDYGWRMAWSEYLPQRYREMKERDMRLWLPLLTEKDNEGLYAKARCDWFDVVSDVYESCYFAPMVNWLNKYNMYYISNLWEESLLLQAAAMGDFMHVTRTATMPGTDCLLMKSQDVHDFKEVQTIAELEDRPFMSEIMGVAGWEQTPEMMKMTINSITSFGVNHVVPHGINLNRRVETDPFPPDWFTENPYWNYLHYWTDFSRRASFISRQTELVADVLLFNPQESIWANSEGIFSSDEGYTISESPKVWDSLSLEINQIYSDAMRVMNKNNIDFLIADNHYLQKGTIEQVDNSPKITINKHQFSTIVLPPMCVISRRASAKILEFAREGGVVVVLGELPKGSPEEGVSDLTIISQMKELTALPHVIVLSGKNNRLNEMIKALNENRKEQIRLESSGRLYTCHRKMDDQDFYWLANNTDTLRSFTAWFKDGEGGAEIWNCETGEITAIASQTEEDYKKVSLTLNPYEAYWLVFNRKQSELNNERAPKVSAGDKIALNNKWMVSYPGVDTIYRTSAKSRFVPTGLPDESMVKPEVNDTEWEYSSFIAGQESLAKIINKDNATQNESSTEGFVYWRINIPPGAQTVIFPELMNTAGIWIDGKKVSLLDSLIDLPDDAQLLAFAQRYKKIGSSVSPLKFVVSGSKERPLKSWYEYGLEQYTGYVDYEATIPISEQAERVFIDLGKVRYMAEVFINDQSVGARLWPPFRFDITNEVKIGDNKIRIRVGNLMVNEMWKNDDMGKLRTWGWVGVPDFSKYNAGIYGPVELEIKK